MAVYKQRTKVHEDSIYKYNLPSNANFQLDVVVDKPKIDARYGLEMVLYDQNKTMRDSHPFTSMTPERIHHLYEVIKALKDFADDYFKDVIPQSHTEDTLHKHSLPSNTDFQLNIVLDKPRVDAKYGIEIVLYDHNTTMRNTHPFTGMTPERINHLYEVIDALKDFASDYFKDVISPMIDE